MKGSKIVHMNRCIFLNGIHNILSVNIFSPLCREQFNNLPQASGYTRIIDSQLSYIKDSLRRDANFLNIATVLQFIIFSKVKKQVLIHVYPLK